ncbi:hypothetical protein [Labrys neptuniae]
MTDLVKKYVLVAAFVCLVVLALATAVDFSFFVLPSGLTISNTILPWQPSRSYLAAFAVAAGNSLAAGLISIVLCTILGVGIGLIGARNNPTIAFFYNLYVGAFRNVPILFVILLFYFVGIALPNPAKAPSLFGLVYFSNRGVVFPSIELSGWLSGYGGIALIGVAVAALVVPLRLGLRLLISLASLVLFMALALKFHAPAVGKFGFTSGMAVPVEFMVLTFALSIYYSVEIAEITRGAVLSISRGLVDAAHALGLHAVDRFRLVLAPLAFRFGLPSALNTYLVVLKATSLGVAIGYTELFSVARLSIASSGRVLECLALMGAYYLIMCGALSVAANLITEKLKQRGR